MSQTFASTTVANSPRTLAIQGLGVAVPATDIAQTDVADAIKSRCAFTDAQHARIDRIFAGSGIERRGSVLLTNGHTPACRDQLAAAYPGAVDREDRGPGIGQRMQWYEANAFDLAFRASQHALQDAGLDASDITDVVTVSCTGFSSPGVDIAMMQSLGIPLAASRTNVGFMGCHGALNGMRVTNALANAKPDGHVLMCCVELCSVHFQYGYNAQHIVANALFADGAASLVANAAAHQSSGVQLIDQASIVLPDSSDAMTWRVRDHGFEMTLSLEVPRLIETHLHAWLTDWLASHDLTIADIAGWAVHPGGPKILDAVEDALHLPSGQCDASRAVLKAHGNMSSPTVLFVVDELLKQDTAGPILALAFGPGLTIEAALFEATSG